MTETPPGPYGDSLAGQRVASTEKSAQLVEGPHYHYEQGDKDRDTTAENMTYTPKMPPEEPDPGPF